MIKKQGKDNIKILLIKEYIINIYLRKKRNLWRLVKKKLGEEFKDERIVVGKKEKKLNLVKAVG